jgi:hypothetical protein
MSIINNGLLLAAEAAAAPPVTGISRSLRFNAPDTAYLSRTPASAGNRKTWTWAGWVKRTVKNTATDQMVFTGGTTSSDTGFLAFDFNSSDKLRLSSAATNFLITTAVYRDPCAWMHIVLAFDATQGTDANKAKLYVNGTEVTVFDTDGRSSISNQDYGVNQAAAHEIGRASLGSNKYLDGYLADVFLIDGQALDPSSFGEFDTNGVWQPIEYAGTYGTNGFHLTFSDNSGTSSTTLGKDAAGSNNWTPNNFSVAAGSGNDSLVDVPVNGDQTDTGIGGEVRGNYATLNPLDKGANISVTNGNLTATVTSTGGIVLSTFGVSSGKWYWEMERNGGTDCVIGIARASASKTAYLGSDANGWGYIGGSGNKVNNASSAAYGTAYASGVVVGVALDMDAGTVTFYRNGTSQGIAYSGLTGTIFPAFGTTNNTDSVFANFGQRPFAYAAPSGFKALCTTNLPTPTIADGSTAMDVALYTGNGSTQTISGLNFSPDFIWIKPRSAAVNHALFDIVRGATNRLISNLTNAEDVVSAVTAFNSDGWSQGGDYNNNGDTYVAWTWDAGSSTVTNNDGSISSQVRANPGAGFSVATLTTPGSGTFTVGHGLNVAPSLVICKARNATFSWIVYHRSAGAGNYLVLNTTAASAASATIWQNTNPSSTVVYGDATNWGTANYVMYSFAPVAGYSSFGSYTGNGSADGPFVHTSMKPAFVLIKATAAVSGNWMIYDNKRGAFNLNSKKLAANASFEENNGPNLGDDSFGIDFLSNGFKIQQAGGNHNNNGTQYIYAAFGEHPFSISRAR